MAFTYDPSTPAGQVRLLIPDRVEVEAIFDDAEVAGFLALEAGDVRRAAALALETAASDQALADQILKSQGDEVRPGQGARTLLERAARLRQLADRAEADLDAEPAIDVIEHSLEPFGRRARVENQRRRGGV